METILSLIFVTATQQSLSASAIAAILYSSDWGEGLKEKREGVNSIVESLYAIFYVEERTNIIRACHHTVFDFIGSFSNGGLQSLIKPLSIRPKDLHARIFEGFLEIMNRELQFNICDLKDSHRLNKDVPDLSVHIVQNISEALQYTTLFWFNHLEQSGVEESGARVHAFLNSPKALYWTEVLSLLDAVDRGILLLRNCTRFFAVCLNSYNILRSD